MMRISSRLCCSLLLAPAWPALAQQALVHTVQPGDNLYHLAQRYLEDPSQWRQLQALNEVRNPRRLMPGSLLTIPAALLRSPATTAQVLHVTGTVSARSAGGTTALRVGERIEEGALIEVAEGGFATLRLADGSVLRLASGTQARLSELRHAPAPGHAQSRIELDRGRVDATVTPLPTPRSRFEIRTRRAVGGVRGTDFGVAANEQGDFIGDVREGAIQVTALETPRPLPATLLQAGEGAHVGSGGVTVARLSAAPDLSALPSVVEDIATIELPLPGAPGATAWMVRIARDEQANQVLRNGLFSQPLARFEGLEDGHYHLRVRVLDAHGIPGAVATRALEVNARPVPPLLREPRPRSRLPAPEVELLCTEGEGAVGYRFQLERDAAFTDLIEQTADLARCQHTLRALVPGSYHWRVAAVARDAKGQRDQGPFSPAMAFDVVPLPPEPAPPQMRTHDGSLHLQWSASAGGPWQHQIQIAHDAAFTRPLDDRLLAEPSFTRAAPAPGLYHVRVRQLDAEGLRGPWTGAQRLEIPTRVLTTDLQPLTNSEGQPVQHGNR